MKAHFISYTTTCKTGITYDKISADTNAIAL